MRAKYPRIPEYRDRDGDEDLGGEDFGDEDLGGEDFGDEDLAGERAPAPLADGEPAARAGALVDELGIEDPAHIDVEMIAALHDVFVKYRRLERHEGHLLRDGRVGLIVVDEEACRSEKWRFVIAHELGHFFLHPALDQFETCTAEDIRAGGWRRSRREREANLFAAELLMPSRLFAPGCASAGADLHTIRALADRFRTSMTATALQFVAHTEAPCAVVHVGARGTVEWASASRSFALRLRPGSRLSPGSHTYDLLEGYDLPDAPLPVESRAWSRTLRGRHLSVYEHALLMRSYGAALVMLSHD